MYSWISIFARTSCSFFFVTLWHCSFRIGFRSKVSIRLKFRFRYRRMWMLDINICQSENWRDQCKLTKTQLLFTLSDHYIKQYIQNQPHHSGNLTLTYTFIFSKGWPHTKLQLFFNFIFWQYFCLNRSSTARYSLIHLSHTWCTIYTLTTMFNQHIVN